MKKIIFAVSLFSLLAPSALFSVDFAKSANRLLSSLTKQYVEAEPEVFFKEPIAILPFENASPLAEQYEIGSLIEEVVRSELALSAYFVLTERKNLDRIMKEVEFSLTDFASSDTALRVGEITGATLFVAGSVTEAGEDFIISARLIRIEKAVVIAADSVKVPKEELITEARSYQFRFVERQGLGLFSGGSADWVVLGMDGKNRLQSEPLLLRFSTGVSYRVLKALQISAGYNASWTEFQFGEFDPTGPAYRNASRVSYYYTLFGAKMVFPSYSFEYTQNYADIRILFVWNPLQRLALSIGGGGLLGMWKNYIKLSSLPIPFIYNPASNGDPFPDPALWTFKDVVMESGNGLLYGFLVSLKAEYYLSPRILFFFDGSFRMTFAGDPYRYTFGGLVASTDGYFFELSQWQPNMTPYGDSLMLDLGTLGASIGVSLSF